MLDKLPLKFLVFVDYERELLRKIITIGVDSDGDCEDCRYDVTSESGMEGFIERITRFYGYNACIEEIEFLSKRLKPLSPEATRDEVKKFTESVVEEVLTFIKRVDEIEKDVENEAYSFNTEIPIYTCQTVRGFIRDRSVQVFNWIDIKKPSLLDEKYDEFTGIVNVDCKLIDLIKEIKQLVDELFSFYEKPKSAKDYVEKEYGLMRDAVNNILSVVEKEDKIEVKWIQEEMEKVWGAVES